jgi:hypothetical protein
MGIACCFVCFVFLETILGIPTYLTYSHPVAQAHSEPTTIVVMSMRAFLFKRGVEKKKKKKKKFKWQGEW